ncbi:MAG: response regulator [Chloroflexi bacterium]|nr:response regulator [Chloroflexota bacterium]
METSYHILVVDDDRTLAEMLIEFLRISGFPNTDHAWNLKEMWERFASSTYDLVILDYLLPDGTGLDALQLIQERGIEVAVIMATGQGDERVAAQAIQRGAADYLVKNTSYLSSVQTLIPKTIRNFRLQQSVQRSLEQIRYQAMLLNNVRDAIVVWDLDGRITYWNPAAEQLYGWSQEEQLGRCAQEAYLDIFSPPLTLNGRADILGRYIELCCQPKDQQTKWISVCITALYRDPLEESPMGYMAVSHDITERKKKEAQIRAAQTQLTQVARLTTIGEMASGVAHQINNPLTTIIADTQLLLKELPVDHPARESAEAIEQAGWRVHETVQRLLEFSRPAEATSEILNINTTIQHALQLIGAQIEAAGIKIVTELDEDIPSLRGNSRQLEDLWVNLLLLARDACHSQPDACIHIRSRAAGNTLHVEVQDNGKLIPEELLDTIFEPDFVGSSSGRGTGMELSICREIVRQHGGQIAVESRIEHGTTFGVTFNTEPSGTS